MRRALDLTIVGRRLRLCSMTMQLYNLLARGKVSFQPADPKRVTVYVCGPTVYDVPHIGNARSAVVFDQLVRLLRLDYGDESVWYVRNITDVDDKINAAALERGISIRSLTEETNQAYQEALAVLAVLPPDEQPRVTETIDEIVAMIVRLIAAGHAYEAEGHVLFSVASFKDYGKLSGRSRAEQIDGARVEVAPYKKNAADFVLWKPSSPELPGWESPWGFGRPGWHIECSAMIEKHLSSSTIDIHGGGNDLIFPHHENELAQSTCAHDHQPLARVWLHNGMLTVDGTKMSKSLGNFITVTDVLDWGFPGEAIRYYMLKTHYRQPMDWTRLGLAQAWKELDGFYGKLRTSNALAQAGAAGAGEAGEAATVDLAMSASAISADRAAAARQLPAPFLAALRDDLNSPLAISHLHQMTDPKDILAAGWLLGLLQLEPESWFTGTSKNASSKNGSGKNHNNKSEFSATQIEQLISERNAARAAKDFAKSDAIRDRLFTAGIVLEDSPSGTVYRQAR